ncbi:MAG: phage tail sheath family protein [Chitinophagales bacterium]|nr:phage tail sheath family protein [Chitinophagales bacterium]
MAGQYKTPGVYIEEVNAFPNSVVAIPTAIPAFVGYTEKAMKNNKPLDNEPTKISSLLDYESWFGGGYNTKYDVTPLADGESLSKADFVIDGKGYTFSVNATSREYFMYLSMLLFYANGGGDAYIVSVGDYDSTISSADLEGGIKQLEEELEPTMLVIPDTMLLGDKDACYSVQKKMIQHCYEMQSRVSILDIYDGYMLEDSENNKVVDNFREGLAEMEGFNYAAAYYPWINTNIIEVLNVNFTSFSTEALAVIVPILDASVGNNAQLKAEIAKLNGEVKEEEVATLNALLYNLVPAYKDILVALTKRLNLSPTSGAMAGVYTMVDNNVGVWKAPANIGINNLVSPTVLISATQQEDLNVPVNGKAVNAIRTLPGRGTLIWGARTLDGNSQDWRYVNVRRTMIFLEQSIKAAAEAFVFEPNNTTTWISVRSMIVNFLTNVWAQGALMGAKPAEAFSVAVGLGQTMTANDVLDGYMRVTVKVAIVRPAEFIVITFQQQMQGA